MLSHDELNNGSTFILKLQNAAGVWSQWVQTLHGDTARHWYEIYRDSDWPALRAEAGHEGPRCGMGGSLRAASAVSTP